jgi:hypothetical protein
VKILLVSALYAPDAVGGAEAVVADLARWLAGRKEDVTVLTLTPGRKVRYGRVDGIKVLRLPLRNIYWFYPKRRRNLLAKTVWHLLDGVNVLMYLAAGKVFRRLRPDLVHTHQVTGFSTLIWLAAKRAGIPLVHTLHDYSGRRIPGRPDRSSSAAGTTAGLGLQGDDAEVLFGREEERPGPLQMVAQHREGLVPQEGDIGARQGPDLGHFGAVADQDQAFLRHGPEGRHQEIHALVGDEPAGGDVEIVPARPGQELLGVHGRIDHLGLPAVDLENALPDELGVGDEAVHPETVAHVPAADAVQLPAGEPGQGPALQSGALQVGEIVVPGAAHR